MAEPSLDSLVSRARTGDELALQALLLHIHDLALGRILRQLPLDISRRTSPEDVLQQVFVSAFRGISGLKAHDYAGFRGWISVLTDNCVRTVCRRDRALRRHGVHRPIPAPDAERFLASIIAESRSPRSRLSLMEELELARQALAALDPIQRSVLQLRYYEQLGYEEIAQRIGRTSAATRMMAVRALRLVLSRLRRHDQGSRNPARQRVVREAAQ